jgi:hypothetical protein
MAPSKRPAKRDAKKAAAAPPAAGAAATRQPVTWSPVQGFCNIAFLCIVGFAWNRKRQGIPMPELGAFSRYALGFLTYLVVVPVTLRQRLSTLFGSPLSR